MKNILTILLLICCVKLIAQKPTKSNEYLLKKMDEKFKAFEYKSSYDIAQKILIQDTANIIALNYKMLSAFEINEYTNATNAANKIIENINLSSLFAYIKEHEQQRDLLRNAYNLKAWIICLETNEKSKLETALEDINKCLSITSPIDKEESLPYYMDTKIRILLKLNRLTEAHAAANKILKKVPDFEGLADIKASEEYKNYLIEFNKSGWGLYIKGEIEETAIQALTRYSKFVELYCTVENVDSTYIKVNWMNKKFSLIDIELVETKLNFKFPKDYIAFATQYGNFNIGYGYSLLELREITKLSDALRSEWNIDFKKNYTALEIENLNNLICFAMGEEGRQDIWYYVFNNKTKNSENGLMLVSEYRQDDWSDLMITTTEKQKGNIGGFDAYMSNLVDDLIKQIIEE